MNTEVLVDALPYFDAGFDDPGVRETVNKAKIRFVYNRFYQIHYFRYFRLLRWWTRNAVDTSLPKTTSNSCRHSTRPASKRIS